MQFSSCHTLYHIFSLLVTAEALSFFSNFPFLSVQNGHFPRLASKAAGSASVYMWLGKGMQFSCHTDLPAHSRIHRTLFVRNGTRYHAHKNTKKEGIQHIIHKLTVQHAVTDRKIESLFRV